jgi:pimeloyl-ACP methyl ester carboxylesterase
VALRARQLSPASFGRLTLLDIAPGPIPPVANTLEPVLEAVLAAPDHTDGREPLRVWFTDRGISPAMADWLLMNLEPDPAGGLRWRIDRPALAGLHARTRADDLWAAVELGATHTVRGGRSRFVSDADVARFAAVGVATDTLAGAGHFIHVDAQDALLDILYRVYSTE